MTYKTMVELVQMHFPDVPPGLVLTKAGHITDGLGGERGAIIATKTLTNGDTTIDFDTDLETGATWIESVTCYDATGGIVGSSCIADVDTVNRKIYLRNGDLELLDAYPELVASIVVKYRKNPASVTPVTALTSDPEIPDRFHDLYPNAILADLYMAKDPRTAQVFRNLADKAIREYKRWINVQ